MTTNTKQLMVVEYGPTIENEIKLLSAEIERLPALSAKYNPRWLAIQLLEGDESLTQKVKTAANGDITRPLAQSLQRLQGEFGEDVDVEMAEHRYRFVNGLVSDSLTRPQQSPITFSDRLDRIVTHRLLGIPIFLALMWAVFKLTADASGPFLDWVDGVIGGPLTNWTAAILGAIGLGGTWFESLIVDGIIAGVGGVLVFVPVLMMLYIALAVLEDSGYMARAAFVMDRAMSALGLHGKSFLPMVVGFGCTVPAFYATRTLENEKDRILTGLLVPFMSCGARLPVYVLFAAAFFPDNAGAVIFGLYVLGIVTAMVLGVVLSRTLFKGEERAPFVMELPPYRVPTLQGIWSHTWERTSSFVRKAWTLIMATSIIIWVLLALPVTGDGSFADTDVANSAFATVSKVFAPALAPMGTDSWEASGALLTGFVAKEVVVATMAQAYNIEEAEEETEAITFIEDVTGIVTSFVSAAVDTVKSIPLIVGINLFEDEAEEEPTELMTAISAKFNETSNGHGALAALAYLVFVLIYTPCMVAVAAERQEFGMKWTWVSIIGQLVLAWIMATIVFQGGLLLGLG